MPINFGSASALLSSMNTAVNITKAIAALRDIALLREKVIELQGVILNAQQAALAAQRNKSALQERISQLEKELASAKVWSSERDKYHLYQMAPGALAYALKKNTGSTEPPHWICAACYDHGRKSILQDAGRMRNDDTTKILKCPHCKADVFAPWNAEP